MSTEDKDRIRHISFKEFADNWLDSLDNRYDEIGDIWTKIFFREIREHLLSIVNKTDALISLIEATGAEEAYQAFVSDFNEEQKIKLPAYEALIPLLRLVGCHDNDSALVVLSIFEYARARRPGGTQGDNIGTD